MTGPFRRFWLFARLRVPLRDELGGLSMTTSVARIIERLRQAGFEITPLRQSPLWMVEGRGNMTTGQLIDLESKLRISAGAADFSY